MPGRGLSPSSEMSVSSAEKKNIPDNRIKCVTVQRETNRLYISEIVRHSSVVECVMMEQYNTAQSPSGSQCGHCTVTLTSAIRKWLLSVWSNFLNLDSLKIPQEPIRTV